MKDPKGKEEDEEEEEEKEDEDLLYTGYSLVFPPRQTLSLADTLL
jgi:hypothetical protein